MTDWKQIYIIADPQHGSNRHLIAGISDYAHEATDWELEICHPDDIKAEGTVDDRISGFMAPLKTPRQLQIQHRLDRRTGSLWGRT